MLHQAVINELLDTVAEKERERDDVLEEIKNLNLNGLAPASDFKSLHSRIHELELEIEMIRERISVLEEEQKAHPNYKEYFGREGFIEEHSTSLSWPHQGSKPVRQTDN